VMSRHCSLKLLLVTYHFPPDGEIGAIRPHQLARFLPMFGFEPWVLTVESRFAESLQTGLIPIGVREEDVCRTPVCSTLWDRAISLRTSASSSSVQSASRGAVPRAAGPIIACAKWWAARRDRRAGWYRPAVQAGDALIRRVGVDLLVSTSPPRVAARVAHELARRHRLPWVMDLRDPYVAESSGGRLIDEILRLALQSRFRSHAKRARLLVHNTERLRELTCRLVPDIEDKTLCIPNGLDPEWLTPPADILPDVFRVSYYGQIMRQRSPAVFFQGVSNWLSSTGLDPVQVSIRFVGPGLVDVPREAAAFGIERLVETHPPVPRREISAMMADDFALLLLANGQPMQVPGKTYEYLASGRRIIAVAERESATADVLKDQGQCFVAETPSDVAAILNRLFKEFQLRSSPRVDRTETVREMEYIRRVERFAAALHAVAQPRHRPR
jgi:glycosyltransferase involved in cell wall biosynthesis